MQANQLELKDLIISQRENCENDPYTDLTPNPRLIKGHNRNMTVNKLKFDAANVTDELN